MNDTKREELEDLIASLETDREELMCEINRLRDQVNLLNGALKARTQILNRVCVERQELRSLLCEAYENPDSDILGFSWNNRAWKALNARAESRFDRERGETKGEVK